MKPFKKPGNIFEEDVNEIFKTGGGCDFGLFMNIVDLLIHQSPYDENLYNLYKCVGLDNFIKIIDVLENQTVKFPSLVEVKESVLLALCYYYREIKKLDWKEIKEKLPFEISSISFGTKIKSLNEFLSERVKDLDDYTKNRMDTIFKKMKE